MKDIIEFNQFGEASHQRIIEIFEKDKGFQEEYKDFLATIQIL